MIALRWSSAIRPCTAQFFDHAHIRQRHQRAARTWPSSTGREASSPTRSLGADLMVTPWPIQFTSPAISPTMPPQATTSSVQPGKEILDHGTAPRQQSRGRGGPAARPCAGHPTSGKYVALQHRDDGIEIRQRPRGQQAAHARAGSQPHAGQSASWRCSRLSTVHLRRGLRWYGRRSRRGSERGPVTNLSEAALKPDRSRPCAGRSAALTSQGFPCELGPSWKPNFRSFDPARRAGGHRAAGAANQRRAGHPAAADRHCAGLRAGHAVAGIAARTGAAGGVAAADLFGQRRHELARIQIQPPPDHPAVGRLRDLHRASRSPPRRII